MKRRRIVNAGKQEKENQNQINFVRENDNEGNDLLHAKRFQKRNKKFKEKKKKSKNRRPQKKRENSSLMVYRRTEEDLSSVSDCTGLQAQ